jgi:hypothetical protein
MSAAGATRKAEERGRNSTHLCIQLQARAYAGEFTIFGLHSDKLPTCSASATVRSVAGGPASIPKHCLREVASATAHLSLRSRALSVRLLGPGGREAPLQAAAGPPFPTAASSPPWPGHSRARGTATSSRTAASSRNRCVHSPSHSRPAHQPPSGKKDTAPASCALLLPASRTHARSHTTRTHSPLNTRPSSSAG